MTYEKPVIIDLSRQSEKGFGYNVAMCSDGSGDTAHCITGPTAEFACDGGITFSGGSVKYED
jgi:hypothetical protein